MESGSRARQWFRRAAAIVAVLCALAVLVLLAAHTSPVRRTVLRRATVLLEERLRIALSADELTYDLFSLRVSLSGASIAAQETRSTPFLVADSIEVTFPHAVLFGGRFEIDRVRIENARLIIRRGADGVLNLPSGRGDATPGEPPSVRIGHIEIPKLAVTVLDETHDFSLDLPAVSADMRADEGRIRLTSPGRFRRGGVDTEIATLGGGLTFDGKALHLSRLMLTTSEANVELDGTIALLVRESRADLRFSGGGDIAALARWGTSDPVATGDVRFEGTVAGPLNGPTAKARVHSAALSRQAFRVSDVSVGLTVNTRRLDVSDFDAAVASGRVRGGGDVTFDSGEITASVSWSDLNIEALSKMLWIEGDVPISSRATGAAEIRGVGGNLRAWTIDAHTRLGAQPGALGRVPMSGDAQFQISGGQWKIGSSHSFEGGAVAQTEVGGVIDGEHLGSSSLAGRVALSAPDLPAFVAALETADLLDASAAAITSGHLSAQATLTGSIDAPAFQIAAEGRDWTGKGIPDIGIDVTAGGTWQEAAIEGRVRQGALNEATVSGSVWPDAARFEGRMTGSVAEPANLLPDVLLRGQFDFELDVRGPFSAMTASGTAKGTDARYGDLRLGGLDATIRVEPKTASFEVTAAELGTRAWVDIGLQGSRTGSVRLQVQDIDLGHLGRAANLPTRLEGTLSLTASGEAALDAWKQGTAVVDVSRLSAAAGNLPIGLIEPARFTYEHGTVDVISLQTAVGNTRFSLAGRYPVIPDTPAIDPADAIRGVLVGDLGQVIAAIRAAGLSELENLRGQGPLAVLVRATGSGTRPVISADLEVGPAELVEGDLPPITDLQLRARLVDGWAEIVDASARWQQAQIATRGRVPLHLLGGYLPEDVVNAGPRASGPASLTVRALSVTPRVLEPFLDSGTIADIEGTIDASAEIDATTLSLESLRGEARIDRLDLAIAGLPVTQREPTRITLADGYAQVASWDWTGEGTSLAVRGRVGLADRRAAIQAAGQIDMRLLTPFVGDSNVALSGTLAPRITVTGPLGDPDIEGEVTLASGGLRLREPSLVATDISGVVSLSPGRARVTALTGVLNGGLLTGSGELTYGADGPPTGQINTVVFGMGLQFPEGLRSELDADVTLTLGGTSREGGGRLTGSVTVLRGAYRDQLAVVSRFLSTVRAERVAALAAPRDSFLNRLDLNVRVVTNDDVIVDNNVARVQIGGDLRVIGTAAAPALSGRATLRERGEIYLGRNRYSIESGTIDFTNPDVIEPNMNIEALTRSGGEEIVLTLKGTPDALDVNLRSVTTPELSQADVASLLLTGRRLDDVSGAEAQIVGEQLLGYVSGDVLGAASRVVGLDTIRLGGVDDLTRRRGAGAIADEADPTSRMTFSKALGRTVDITLSQSLRDSDAQTWIVDYTRIPHVNLRFVSDDDSLRSYEFQHDLTFGAAEELRRDAPVRAAPTARVSQVVFTGDLGMAEDRLRQALSLEPGELFDFTAWQRDRDRLEQALRAEGRIEARVTARRAEEAGAVTLTYDVDAGPVATVAVSGYTLSSAMRREIDAAWGRSVFDGFLRDEVAAIVRRALVADGYLQPAITVTIATDEVKTLSIAVEPGGRARARRVVVDARDAGLGPEIDRWIRDQGLEALAWREPEALEGAVIGHLRSRGHAAPRVTVAPPTAEGDTVVFHVDVDAGPVVSVGTVSFPGAQAISSDRLIEVAAVQTGSPYDPTALDQARERVARAYRLAGFADARVLANAEIDAAGSLANVTFTVEEGPRQVLRELLVRGNRAIDRQVVVRALDLEIGATLAADSWLTARSRLFDTALFRRVDVTTEVIEDAQPDDSEKPARMVVTVEEWPALRVRYGVQLSEERPEGEVEGRDLTPGLSADVTRPTLFGRAIAVGGAAQYEARERLVRAFLNAPMLAGLPIESLLSVERAREDDAAGTFVTDSSKISWEQRVRVQQRLRLSYSYSFERNHTFDTSDPRPGDPFPPYDVKVHVARFTGAAVFDTRDDPIGSTRGWLASSSFEVAPQSLGSEFAFLRHLGQAYYFKPVGRVVLASAARVGLAKALGGQAFLPSERFFAGGARTVRGVEEDGLGPRDVFGVPAGGRALVVLNQEVRFPLFRWFSGVGFVDAGNVFATPREMDLGDLVGSSGVGLRIATPFALLRLDFAQLWSPQPGQQPRWSFGIGHTF